MERELEREELAAVLPNIAGQLRTQMSTMYLAITQAIPYERREADPELDRKASVYEQSFYRMLRMTDSMTMARYFSKSDPLPLRDGDLVELVSRLCETATDLAEAVGVQLRFVCAMEHRYCALHRGAVEHIFYHLLSNALKATPKGGSVTVELRKSGGDLLLTVADTGRGIPAEQLDGLFQPHITGPEPGLLAPGLHLGLALCQTLAEQHGGRIAAVSQPGEGSRFTVSLPDRSAGDQVSDVPQAYDSGFNRPLLGLADALPSTLFTVRDLD